MDPEAFVEAMFKAEPGIRYMTIVNSEYRILISKQREGVPSLTSEEIEHNFFSIIPQIIVEAVEKLSPFLGKVGGITAHYEKVIMLFFRLGDLTVVLSFERNEYTPFFNRVRESFAKFSSQYLK
jgi:hypothetical protein